MGISLAAYAAMETMRRYPLDKFGIWKKTAQQVADFYGVEPGELFPQAVLDVANPVSSKKIDATDLASMLEVHEVNRLQERNPSELGDVLEAHHVVKRVMQDLTDRERDVVCGRFGIDRVEESLDEAGKRLGVSRERVRQIEMKAIRKLRSVWRLRSFMFGDEV